MHVACDCVNSCIYSVRCRNTSDGSASVSSSISSMAGSGSPPDSADSGSECGETFPGSTGSNEDTSGPEKAPAKLDEDKVPLINNTEPTENTESVQPALWLQNKYESTDNNSGAKPYVRVSSNTYSRTHVKE